MMRTRSASLLMLKANIYTHGLKYLWIAIITRIISTYLLGIYLAVNDNPCSTPQLCARWQVHNHRLFVRAQILDDDRASLHESPR